ncbi:MAG: Imm12 family immunity protein [Stenotrophomonas sp.]
MKFLPGIVQARTWLKSALEEVSVDGLDVIDVELWISGSVTDYCPAGVSSSTKFSARRRSVRIAICIAIEEASRIDDDSVASAIEVWLVRGFESAALPRSAGNISLSGAVDALKSRFT